MVQLQKIVVAPFLFKNQFSCGSAVMEAAVQVLWVQRTFHQTDIFDRSCLKSVIQILIRGSFLHA